MELEAPSHHLHPLPNTHHRKIELQSPLDLEYLRNNLLLSTQQKLDLNLPPSAFRKPPAQPATFISLDGPPRDASSSSQPSHPQPQPTQPHSQQQQEDLEDDRLRQHVQSLLSAFLTRTWSSAAQSITINGLDASSLPTPTDPHSTAQQQPVGEREGVDFTYSPYDARLQSQVASLYGELETLTAQVSKLRREAPSTGAQRYSEQLREQMALEEEEYQQEMQSIHDQQQQSAQHHGHGQTEDVLNLDKPRPGYYEDMQATYAHGVEELARLAGVSDKDSGGQAGERRGGGSLTETVGKVQRARTVALEFE